MRRTNLGDLKAGSRVNLERALRVGDRLGGHIVSGHVDGTGSLRTRSPEGNAMVLAFTTPAAVLRYVAEKGSICVDGVSLTVMDVQADGFRVSIIPHTGEATAMLSLPLGARVNLECDVIAKYVERLLTAPAAATASAGQTQALSGISETWLREQGF